MSGRQKLGELIRSITYGKVKGDPEDPLHPTAKLKYLKENCQADITFEEIKDGFAAFEEEVCVKMFIEADKPGFDVADKTVEILLELMSDFVKKNKGKEKVASEIEFHALMALIKAGPNSSHVGLMWNFTDHGLNLKQHVQRMKKKELVELLETLNFYIKYTKNHACDEKVYFASVCARLEDIYKMISKEQYKTVQREFLRAYNLKNNQIQIGSEISAPPIFELVDTMIKQYGNPYLNLNPKDDRQDAEVYMFDYNMLIQLCMSIGNSNAEPTANAARLLMELLIEAMFKDSLVPEYCPSIMAAVQWMFSTEWAEKCKHVKENIMYTIREVLLRGIAEKNINVMPFFKSCMDMTIAILSKETVSRESHLVIEDVTTIVIKRAKPLSEEDVRQVLEVCKGIILCGHRELVRKLDPVFEALRKQKCLDWKKYIHEAEDIVDAFGNVTADKLKRDYDQVYTVAVYRLFIKNFLNMLKQSGILPAVQSNLVKSFFKNLQDTTLLKVPMAQTIANPDFMDFSRDLSLRLQVLRNCENLLKNKSLPWHEGSLIAAVANIVNGAANAYKGNGRNVSVEENEIFISIFKNVSQGGKSVIEQWYQEDNEGTPNINLEIWTGALKSYVELHQKSGTLVCVSAVMHDIIRWAKIAVKDEHEDMISFTLSVLSTVGQSPPTAFNSHIPDLLGLLLKSDKCQDLYEFIKQLYLHNPGAVYDELQKIFDSLDSFQDTDMENIYQLVLIVSENHQQVFSKAFVKRMIDRTKVGSRQEQMVMLNAMNNVAEKCPQNVVDVFQDLCDDSLFDEDSMEHRSSILAFIGAVNKNVGEKSVDYLMRHALSSSPVTVRIAVKTLYSMLKTNESFIQKYKPQLEKLEKSTKDSKVKDVVHDIILVLEGKTFENVVGEVQQQKEDIGALDVKVDATVDTVVTIGGKVIEHEKEIGELGEGLERVEEKVEEVDESLGDTKIKVEEIDKKTMSNAPTWSRDLTKLMNPTADNDWRLLAKRLGYSKDDIRAWATQHDPCMALLSEWYATHKTSEASFGVLTALTEMNRKDGVVIVENSMKAAEGVVEDEEFEYSSPPPVFLSYQWGVQNEVKLLKQHLNMAGYECWMDVGQMGGGDKLFAKIDNGIRAAKTVICCVTEKYAESPNCNREVNLAVNLNKPVIPLLMEKTDWPPKGSMGPIFSEYLFIRFFQRGGEETTDKRYWPVPKFQELLMQLNFFVVPDQKMVSKEYKNWWLPMVEDIEIDKTKQQKQTSSKSQQTKSQVSKSPVVFLSYQWGKQEQVKALYKRLSSLGYTVWMDIYQMGGGDSLYDKIDKGVRGCKVVVSCVTEKYSLSANCRREVGLADALKKPIIPLQMERMKWPPTGPMSLVFTNILYITCYQNEKVQLTWTGETFNELKKELNECIRAAKDDVEMVTNDNNVKSTNDDKNLTNEKNDTSESKTHEIVRGSIRSEDRPNKMSTNSRFVQGNNTANKQSTVTGSDTKQSTVTGRDTKQTTKDKEEVKSKSCIIL